MLDYLLLIIVVVLAGVQLFLRVNVAIAFMALSVGVVLSTSIGDSAGLIASSLTSGMNSASNYAKLIVLYLPLIVVIVATRRRAKKHLFVLNLILALSVAVMALVFAHPLLPAGAIEMMSQSEYWSYIMQYQEFILGLGVSLSLLVIVLTNRHKPDKDSKKRP